MTDSKPLSVVLGAGPAGLACAWRLARAGQRVRLVEASPRIGGLAGTFRRGEFLLDFGPHKFFTRMPHVQSLVKELLGEELRVVPKKSGIWFRGRRFNYPLAIKELLTGISPWQCFTCGVSYAAQALRRAVFPARDLSYADWVSHRFGPATYRMIFKPLANKIWGNPETLDADLARVRIVLPDLKRLVLNMVLGEGKGKELIADHFYYPRTGFGAIWDAFAAEFVKIGGALHRDTLPVRIETAGDRVTGVVVKGADGEEETWPAANLVSTIPLVPFSECFSPALPAEALALARGLKYRASLLVYFICRLPRVMDDAWLFVPEEKYVFNRLSEQKNFSPDMGPADRTVLIADISCDLGGSLWNLPDADIIARSLAGVREMGLLKDADVSEAFVVRTPRLYPVYERGNREKMDALLDALERFQNVRSIGRHGFFQHNNSDNAIDMGLQAADNILRNEGAAAWRAKRDEFHAYQIAD